MSRTTTNGGGGFPALPVAVVGLARCGHHRLLDAARAAADDAGTLSGAPAARRTGVFLRGPAHGRSPGSRRPPDDVRDLGTLGEVMAPGGPGPAVTPVHLAVRGLRGGRTDLALVPDAPVEGAGGAVALCRLSDALAEGRRVYAVIHGDDREARPVPEPGTVQALWTAAGVAGLIDAVTAPHQRGSTGRLLAEADRGAPLVVRGLGKGGETGVRFVCGGSRWRAAGRELYRVFPVFRAAFDDAHRALGDHLPLPLVAVVFAPEGGVDARLLYDAVFSQPASFAFEVALARLWQSWGVRIGAVEGHDAGELAAAHVAGLLDLEAAARLVAARGRLGKHPDRGGLSPDEFHEVARSCRFREPALALYSSSTGERAGPGLPPGSGMRSPAYWTRQATGAACFPNVLRSIGFDRVLECGPMGEAQALLSVLDELPSAGRGAVRSPAVPRRAPAGPGDTADARRAGSGAAGDRPQARSGLSPVRR